MDSITLLGVTAHGTHGVLDSEHEHAQPFVVDITLQYDMTLAAHSDDIDQAVNYADVAQNIVKVIEGDHVDLIETLAQRIADAVFSVSRRIDHVKVTVHKPKAPIPCEFADVAVTIERSRHEPTSASLVSAHHHDAIVDREFVDATDWHDHCETHNSKSSAQYGVRDEMSQASHADINAVQKSVQVTQLSHRAFIALGGNMGDVRTTLLYALAKIDGLTGVQVAGISALYETKAWGMPENTPNFLNAVIQVQTSLTPDDLLHELLHIENELGRVREEHWSSRVIDIDIIDYDHEVCASAELMLPHPRAWQRAFVLQPLLDLDPDFVLVGDHGGAVAELLENAPDRDGVERLSESWIIGM